jgi:hypothetical protein
VEGEFLGGGGQDQGVAGPRRPYRKLQYLEQYDSS